MRIFNLNKNYNIVCNSESTRYGFRHLATLHKAGIQIARAKKCYYNRTWEKFQFESVIIDIIKSNFTGREAEKFLKIINDNWGY